MLLTDCTWISRFFFLAMLGYLVIARHRRISVSTELRVGMSIIVKLSSGDAHANSIHPVGTYLPIQTAIHGEILNKSLEIFAHVSPKKGLYAPLFLASTF